MLRTILPLLICTAATPAAAQTLSSGAEGTPVFYAYRGLVLEQGQVRLDFAPRDFGLLYGGIGSRGLARDVPGFHIGRAGGEALLELTVGGAYGVTEDLEVGTVLMPIHIAPHGDFGDIELYGRYRFLTEDSVQVGGQLTLAIPTFSTFGLGVGVPVQFRFGEARIDTGVELEMIFGRGAYGYDYDSDVDVDLDIPVAISFDIIDGFFVGLRSGFFSPDFSDLAIPLQGHVGYALINGDAPFIDLVATFGWPRFVWTGPGDAIGVGTFDVLLGARMFFTVQ